MSAEEPTEGRKVLAVDVSAPSFQRGLKRVCKDQQRGKLVLAAIRELLFADLSQLPAKLHLHQLTNKMVASVIDSSKKVPAWSFHVTPDDRYKASFTFESGCVYFRAVDEHDVIDKNP